MYVGSIWIIWGRSCYYDHEVEFVHENESLAEAHAERLRTGGADAHGDYEHPDALEFWIEERGQTIYG